MTPAPKLLKPPTLELRTPGSSSVQKAAAVDERADSAVVATNASGVELRVDWNGSFYINGPLYFYAVLVTVQQSPPACLQANASNTTLVSCNGSAATSCVVELTSLAYSQRVHCTHNKETAGTFCRNV